MKLRLVFLAGAAFALSVSAPALAHHGWGGYENAESNIVGTVMEQVNLAGAHASIKLQGEDGQIWRVILSPPHSTVAAGIREQTFPVGAKVTVYGHRHRDKLEMKTEELTMGQRTFNLYAWHWGPTDREQLADQQP
jgi:hypothetical protein